MANANERSDTMDRDKSEQMTYQERVYRREKITELTAGLKYAVDKVHSGLCPHGDLSLEEKTDFELYFILIKEFPYEYPGQR